MDVALSSSWNDVPEGAEAGVIFFHSRYTILYVSFVVFFIDFIGGGVENESMYFSFFVIKNVLGFF